MTTNISRKVGGLSPAEQSHDLGAYASPIVISSLPALLAESRAQRDTLVEGRVSRINTLKLSRSDR